MLAKHNSTFLALQPAHLNPLVSHLQQPDSHPAHKHSSNRAHISDILHLNPMCTMSNVTAQHRDADYGSTEDEDRIEPDACEPPRASDQLRLLERLELLSDGSFPGLEALRVRFRVGCAVEETNANGKPQQDGAEHDEHASELDEASDKRDCTKCGCVGEGEVGFESACGEKAQGGLDDNVSEEDLEDVAGREGDAEEDDEKCNGKDNGERVLEECDLSFATKRLACRTGLTELILNQRNFLWGRHVAVVKGFTRVWE